MGVRASEVQSLDTLTDEQRAEEDAVDDELLQRRLDLDVELVLLRELLLGAPDGAQNTAAALRGTFSLNLISNYQ